MTEGRQRETWTHTSTIWAVIANGLLKRPGRPFRPSDVDPFRQGELGGTRITRDNITLLKALVPQGKRREAPPASS